MNSITQFEFDGIVTELLETRPAKYDALCAAAEKLLSGTLRRKFASTPALARVCTYEDVLSEVYIRLIKSAVPCFFLRGETLNDDPNGFCRFVYTVAANICKDKLRSPSAAFVTSLDGAYDDEDDSPLLQIADSSADTPFETVENTETLRAAFETVLDMDVQVYKVLTWVAQAVMILSEGVTKIESNDRLIERFETMTLDEMWDAVRAASGRIPWLRLGEEAEMRLRKMLDTPFNKNVRYGDMRYADFYMKKGAKASISDWVNRINAGIRREMTWNI